jgi:signal transduction histidine kinase
MASSPAASELRVMNVPVLSNDRVQQLEEALHESQALALAGQFAQTLSYYHSKETVEPIQVALVAEAALRIHHKKIAAKEIRLQKELPADLIVESHPGVILQVFSNLIGNAVEALPVRGRLQIRGKCTEREAHILVADNGHGIPAEIRLKIFDPFFSAKKERGTGLGLAIIKAIVEQHRGRIRSRTSTLNGRSGTAFRISLPLRSTQSATRK